MSERLGILYPQHGVLGRAYTASPQLGKQRERRNLLLGTLSLAIGWPLAGCVNFDAPISAESAALIAAARAQLDPDVIYDSSYRAIPYPMGDIPRSHGVCTDVLIRAYRDIGIDLQKLIHEDISRDFASYPSLEIWGLDKPDPNIDHRRVQNMEKFFERNGEKLRFDDLHDFRPGDIVSWRLAPHALTHIGIVSDKISSIGKRRLVIHNYGTGVVENDYLPVPTISGRYRFMPGRDFDITENS